MAGNKIKKKQVDFIPYTTDPNEFVTLNSIASPATGDYLLFEDVSDSNNKKSCTISSLASLISGSSIGQFNPYNARTNTQSAAQPATGNVV